MFKKNRYLCPSNTNTSTPLFLPFQKSFFQQKNKLNRDRAAKMCSNCTITANRMTGRENIFFYGVIQRHKLF